MTTRHPTRLFGMPDLTSLSPVSALHEYKFVRYLGGGEFAAVYEGLDLHLKRAVAIKVLTKPQDTVLAHRFHREAELMAKLDHPNVVAIHAAGNARGLFFLVLQLVRGYSAFELLTRKGTLGVGMAVEIGIQASRGLLAAHEAGILHRDVKPSNLLVDREGVVKVADFGIGKEVDSASRLTGTEQILGTMNYVSPELCEGAEIDHRADIYGLGATIYHLVSGRIPYEDKNPGRVLTRRFNEPPPTLRGIPDVPGELANLVDRMMEREPDARPKDMAEVGREIQRAAQGLEHPSSPLDLSLLVRELLAASERTQG